MEEIRIERLTWTDIRQALQQGKWRVLVVVGSMEQHGPHLPIGTDTYLGYAIAERVARKLGDALVAPVIPFGVSPGHMPFPGTITLCETTLGSVILECCESLARHGFRQVVLLSSHGGNFSTIRNVLDIVREKVSPTEVLATTEFEPWLQRIRMLCNLHGLDEARIGFHAGQGETSQMLAWMPELVRMDRAVEGFLGDSSRRLRSPTPLMCEFSPTGILGDARGATPELGDLFLEAEAEALADLIRSGRL